jgi:hypothetical protein
MGNWDKSFLFLKSFSCNGCGVGAGIYLSEFRDGVKTLQK